MNTILLIMVHSKILLLLNSFYIYRSLTEKNISELVEIKLNFLYIKLLLLYFLLNVLLEMLTMDAFIFLFKYRFLIVMLSVITINLSSLSNNKSLKPIVLHNRSH
ncbi:hypothetical protein H312_00519 [Anncaliia algerae PRA339]|uniref:Uncharacterized protein n=1 Tax=Anncaliia algerae PRA339 TaxID=1288291 RepID=A0A059F4N8_9MICR|nr:hypothetical protein H312_00519 [Anncaliia algerae PRA339]